MISSVTEKDIIITQRTFDEVQADVRAINHNLSDIYIRLLRIVEGEEWTILGYDTWEAMREDVFTYSPGHMRYLLRAARDYRALLFYLQRPHELQSGLIDEDRSPRFEVSPTLIEYIKNIPPSSFDLMRNMNEEQKMTLLEQIASEGALPTPAKIKKYHKPKEPMTKEQEQEERRYKAERSIQQACENIREYELWKPDVSGFASYRDYLTALFLRELKPYDEWGNELPKSDQDDDDENE